METPRKRKSMAVGPEIQQEFEEIAGLIPSLKQHLAAEVTTISRRQALDSLRQVVKHVETLEDLRPRNHKNWNVMAAELDREGVYLWNLCATHAFAGHNDEFVAVVRQAAFSLIRIGRMESLPSIDGLIHLLQLASKTGSALAGAALHDDAGKVLETAAQMEVQMRELEDPQNLHTGAKSRAVIVYYTARMEAAWKQSNDGVARWMLTKIMGDNMSPLLSHLTPRDLQELTIKFHDIGKSILRMSKGEAAENGKRALESVKWIQSAYAVVDRLEDEMSGDLRKGVLRTLVRALYHSSSEEPENLNRAEVALKELLGPVEMDDSRAVEMQPLRWMHLAINKKKDPLGRGLETIIHSIIQHTSWTEDAIIDVLQELRLMSPDQWHSVSGNALFLLQKALDSDRSQGHPFVDRIMNVIFFHVRGHVVHSEAVQHMQAALTAISSSNDYDLGNTASLALVTAIWKAGDVNYSAKKLSQAADWFLLGGHRAFKSLGKLTLSKAYRKAALCYIQVGEYAKASSMIGQCDAHESATSYLTFLTSMHQGLQDEAIRAIQDMIKAPDFDRQMLILATKVAHDWNTKPVLLSVLSALLGSLRHDEVDTMIEAVTLVRCIVRLVIDLAKELPTDKDLYDHSLVAHLKSACALIERSIKNNVSSMILKDISWIWRAAYNQAITATSEDRPMLVELWTISRDLVRLYFEASIDGGDPEVQYHLVVTSFASISCRVIDIRSLDEEQLVERRRLLEDIEAFKKLSLSYAASGEISEEAQLFVSAKLQIAAIFEVELLGALGQWQKILQIIKDGQQTNLIPETLCSIVDLLWCYESCPSTVLRDALEVILRIILEQGALTVERFSRWLRAICTILLARNRESDRTSAKGYIDQAIEVMRDNIDSDPPYPDDERNWLVSISNNTGVECMSAGLYDEAKQWFELALKLCNFVASGEAVAAKISGTYHKLLQRYHK